MRCPDCNARISTKDFDPEWKMYECPKCGGMHLADEIEEANNGTSPRKRSQLVRPAGEDERWSKIILKGKTKPVAKAKKRQTEILDDTALLDRQTEDIISKPTKVEQTRHHKDEMSTKQVVNAWAGEIQDVYHELGGELDDLNASDKALTLWREIQIQTHLTAREQEIPHVMCREHK